MMARGKSICKVLKTIRKQVADANGIEYKPHECHHQGDCRGTCPACEAEVRYIQQQLDLRRQLGKAVAVVGISAGLAALTSCTNKPKNVDKVEMEFSQLIDGKVPKPSANDFVTPENNDTLIVEEDPPLLGDVGPMPSFPGGTEKLFEFIKNNIRYPEIAEKNGVQGRVVVAFVVEVDGSISNVEVVRSVDQSLEEEALRVVNILPKWKPAMLNGKPIRSKYSVPITFRLK
jgi:TonB family protein